MSINSDLAKILKKAGVDPNIYNHEPQGLPRVGHFEEPAVKFGKKDKKKPEDKPKTFINLDTMEEDHGMGYSHNVSLPQDQNTMNKSTIGSLEEYKEPSTRLNSIRNRDEDMGLKLIYHWAKTGTIGFEEFQDLIVELIVKMAKKGLK